MLGVNIKVSWYLNDPHIQNSSCSSWAVVISTKLCQSTQVLSKESLIVSFLQIYPHLLNFTYKVDLKLPTHKSLPNNC